jgi:hypothetical protein
MADQGPGLRWKRIPQPFFPAPIFDAWSFGDLNGAQALINFRHSIFNFA